jgi:hypothetical protein
MAGADPSRRRLWARAPLAVLVAAAAAGGAALALDRSAYVEGQGSRAADTARSPAPTCGPTHGPFRPGRWPGGCWRPYGRRSPFNQPLPAQPRITADSDAIVARLLELGGPQHLQIGTAGTPDDFAHPVAFSRRHDPRYRLRCRGQYGTCPLDGHTIRVPARARPAAGGDAHLAVVDQRRRVEYDLWDVTSMPPRGGTLRFTYGGKTAFGGSGLRAGGTAAGFGLLAGRDPRRGARARPDPPRALHDRPVRRRPARLPGRRRRAPVLGHRAPRTRAPRPWARAFSWP